jgi:hypothetical protein
MITIFSTPRPFKGPFDRIQRNAIKSWMKVCPDCKIILFEDEEKTTAKIAEEIGVTCVTDVVSDEFGTPLLNHAFNKVKELSSSKVIVQINTDIILTDSFLKAINRALSLMNDKPFFMSGKRWDLGVTEKIDFDDINWQINIINNAKKNGKLHGFSGMDYWVLPANAPFEIPPFIVGRPGMDSWLVYKSRFVKMPVIDSTNVIDIVHQNHDYPQKKKDFFEIEKKRNISLAGGQINMMTLREADYILTEKGLEKPKFPRAIFSKLALFYPWRFILLIKRQIRYLMG